MIDFLSSFSVKVVYLERQISFISGEIPCDTPENQEEKNHLGILLNTILGLVKVPKNLDIPKYFNKELSREFDGFLDINHQFGIRISDHISSSFDEQPAV